MKLSSIHRRKKLWNICVFIAGFLTCFILFHVLNFPNNQDNVLRIEKTANLQTDKTAYVVTEKTAYLIVLILSGIKNIVNRNAIRNTWMNRVSNHSNIKYFFIIGKKGVHDYDRYLINEEMKTHHDIMFLTDVEDTYEFLSKKILHAFVFVNKYWKFQYLLKCDDDSFVRVFDIKKELKTSFASVNNLYWGFFNGAAKVKWSGKWKETNWILCDRYIPYALGGGYVLSSIFVRFIAENYKLLKSYSTEDVSVGTWLASLNVTRFHDPRFDTEYNSRGCSNSYLITHKKNPADMYTTNYALLKTGNLCGNQEYKIALSYQYNWNVPPSKCCLRYNQTIP